MGGYRGTEKKRFVSRDGVKYAGLVILGLIALGVTFFALSR